MQYKGTKVRKTYVKPTMEILDLRSNEQLLAGSGYNPYWIPPEEKEGCDTPWWCSK